MRSFYAWAAADKERGLLRPEHFSGHTRRPQTVAIFRTRAMARAAVAERFAPSDVASYPRVRVVKVLVEIEVADA